MRVGLYFGSFNPIHTGHLIIAQHMLSHHGLDEVWFVVTPHNPMKEADGLAPEQDRLEMVRRAVSVSAFPPSPLVQELPAPAHGVPVQVRFRLERFMRQLQFV